jgi:valyl-tRNA synthetase
MADKRSAPSLDGLQDKWRAAWEEQGTYRFDRTKERSEIYSIDTPPPTVSGSLHVGHVFSYTHTDLIARYKRMTGLEVFYPMGWDDNGLATERRVQNHFGVRCDPSLPYEPGLKIEPGGKEVRAVSRPNFVELCLQLTAEDEQAFEDLWRTLGLSIDWNLNYETIGERARRVSQRAFLRLLDRGQAYHREAPTLWDVDFKTAVAQAEVEDREIEGAYHRVSFGTLAAQDLEIETTRPELIPACVALVAHPGDERYRDLFGKETESPLFAAPIPIRAHELADPEVGTGLAMVCTFGDLTDVTWWRDLNLPARPIVDPNGNLRPVEWGTPGWESSDPARANENYSQLVGMYTKKARKRIVEMLRDDGTLIGDPKPVMHAVKFYERGERPLEVLTSRQWFVRTLDLREDLLRRGAELRWHPEYMRARYESWVNGLNQDWCVSRQRFFGVPFPVWYRADDQGHALYDQLLLPDEDATPVDPSTDAPPGFEESQRGQPGGFVADPDVMDTWATSSLSPQIIGGWVDDEDLFQRVFPEDLRPQAHDIIRTWLFYTVLRSHLEHDSLPWTDAVLSGWVVDPNRKKMSKSKGNIVTPAAMLAEYGPDAVRYWAANGAPGADTAFDVQQMRVGRRLAIKVLNASRFVLQFEPEPGADITDPVDRAMLANLAGVVDHATRMFERYEHSRALSAIEPAFWEFCGDYLELVKSRAYGDVSPDGRDSANAALRLALGVHLRLLAPFLPFVTEEAWSWWHDDSVHRNRWPSVDELRSLAGDASPTLLADSSAVLEEIRRAKSTAKLPMRAPVDEVTVRGPAERLDDLQAALDDLGAAGYVANWKLERGGEELTVSVALDQEALAARSQAG